MVKLRKSISYASHMSPCCQNGTKVRMVFILLLILALCGCKGEQPEQEEPTPPPISLDSPVEFTVTQRSTTPLPGSDGSLVLVLDDITGGQVLISVESIDGKPIVLTRSIRQGETVPFTVGRYAYKLKLKELTYIGAEPYSSADFRHGPVAMVAQGFPVLAVVPNGKVFPSMMELLVHLQKDLLAELVIISNSPEALSLAKVPFAIPTIVPEWLSPMVSIVLSQLFSYHLTLAKGYDADQPRTIRKVTETH